MNESNTTTPQTATTAPRAAGHVFISYKSQQAGEADRLQRYIESKGYSCWRAPGSLHKRGTQDYSSDIFQAIREAKCLLFVLSDAALGSDWVQREVNYALNTCHKPVIPFVIDRIPEAKKESNGVYISLQLEKQILNEELSWNMEVLLPYLEKAFGRGTTESASKTAEAAIPLQECSQEEWTLWQRKAEYHLARLGELGKMDILDPKETDLTPEAREVELRLSANEAAMAMIHILTSRPQGDSHWVRREQESVSRKTSADLAKLTYDHGKRFSRFVFSQVQPQADAGIPWANFVLHARYYLSQDMAAASGDEDMPSKVFACLQKAVLDTRNPWAALRLGECWQWGSGCEVSGTRARFWYETANKMGCPDALFSLARLYAYAPAGIRRDEEKAKELAEQGEKAGSVRATSFLGELYRRSGPLQSFEKAEEKLVKAYEAGSNDALAGFAWIHYYSNGSYRIQDDRFSDFNRICWAMKRAGIRRADDLMASQALWNAFVNQEDTSEAEKQRKAAFSFALAGCRNHDWNATTTFASILMDRECRRLAAASPIAWDGILDWLKVQPGVHALPDSILLSACGELCGSSVAPPKELNWVCESNNPKTPFWQELTDTMKFVTDLRKKTLMTPRKYLEALWEADVPEDSELAKVQDIWAMLRILDWEATTAEYLREGAVDVLPPEFLEGSASRQNHLLELLLKRMDDIPLAAHSYQRLHRVLGGNEASDEDRIDKTQAVLKEFEKSLRGAARQTDRGVRLLEMAVQLADMERLISPPIFAAAMSFYRKSFEAVGAPAAASHFAHLFLALNARHFDPARNEGMLFSLREILRKGILLGEPSCAPLYLELCLFGLVVGNSRLQADFSLIEEISPHLFELAETVGEYPPDVATMAEVAFAMGKIYLDAKLYHLTRNESWGHVSLFDKTKGMVWFAIAKRLARKADLPKILELREQIMKNMGEFDESGLLDALDEKTETSAQVPTRDTPAGKKQRTIDELTRRVPPDIDAMAFKHVNLEGENIDFVVSSDSVAVLFAVYPEEINFSACPRGNGNEKSDSMAPNGISPAKLDMLEKQRESLQKMEPDSELHLAVIAGTQTLESMRVAWKNDLEEKGIELVEYADFENHLRKYLPLVEEKDSNGDDETEDDGNGDAPEIG